MKKQLFLLITLTLSLMLSACGSKDIISGQVVEATPDGLVLETNEGKRVAVLLEENTHTLPRQVSGSSILVRT